MDKKGEASTITDGVFKILMDNEELALFIINSVLQTNYSKITVVTGELHEPGRKLLYLDRAFIVEDDKGIQRHVIVEAQTYKNDWVNTKLGLYIARASSLDINVGQRFQDYIKPVFIVFSSKNLIADEYYLHKLGDTQVAITKFKGKKPRYVKEYQNNEFNIKSFGYSSIVDGYVVEINKIPKDNDGNDLWLICNFFQIQNEEEFKMFQSNNPEFAGNEVLSSYYERIRDGYRELSTIMAAMTENSIYADGVEEGREEGITTTAKNLLAEGVDINIIVKATGLSIEEVKFLQDT